MEETNKMKGTISEDDVALILEKYSLHTILKAIQEIGVWCSDAGKIDWHSLVQTTSTGISCPREYQRLWRYLAYRHSLEDDAEEISEPLSDESDLEFGLEPSPAITTEESMEAEAFAEIIMSSPMLKDSDVPTVEAPMIINIPKKRSPDDPSSSNQASSSKTNKNVFISVLVQKHPLPSSDPETSSTDTSKELSDASRHLTRPTLDQPRAVSSTSTSSGTSLYAASTESGSIDRQSSDSESTSPTNPSQTAGGEDEP